MNFQNELLKWYGKHQRDLPWRNTTDPYIIWLSEIILQQTRVEQGLPYFNKFLANYPTIKDFAAATEDDILKLWQGLGYYSRGRNMLFTAQQIINFYDGKFPTAYQDLIKLKGVGAYTAAAIASFSSDEKKAVVDGNVYRVLARYFGIAKPINESQGQKYFNELAQNLILDQKPSLYNQAIMEFGALQCKPKSPNCAVCPLSINCFALKNKQVNLLPVKSKKVKIKERWFNYFLCLDENQIYYKYRKAKDIWQHLYDLPLLETFQKTDLSDQDFLIAIQKTFGENVKVIKVKELKHVLTHQIIYVQFFALENYMINFNTHTEIKSAELEVFDKLPQPKVISDFLNLHVKN